MFYMVLNLAASQSQHFHSGDPLQEILSTALALLALCPRSRKIPFPSLFPPVHCQADTPRRSYTAAHTVPTSGHPEIPCTTTKKSQDTTTAPEEADLLEISNTPKISNPPCSSFLPKREHSQENYTQTDTHIPAALHQKVKGGRKISSLLDRAVLLHP